MSTKTPVERLEEQKKRLASLNDRRMRAQVRLESERRALEEAREEARRLFGTDNLDELRNLYKARTAENERQVSEFITALDEVDKALADIDRQINI